MKSHQWECERNLEIKLIKKKETKTPIISKLTANSAQYPDSDDTEMQA